MSALDFVVHGDVDEDSETNYLDEVEIGLPQPYTLRLMDNPRHIANETVHDWRRARRPPPLHEVDSPDKSPVRTSPSSSVLPAEHSRCATLLTRIREKVFARMTTNDHVVPTTSDYLEPDVDSNDDEDDQDEERDSEGRDRVSKKRDLHTFLMGSTRPLEYDMLPAPLSSDPTGPILPRVMPLPFLFLPPPPSSKQGPTLAKCLLPSVPKTRPPLRKYNQRTIYNCVRCGQKKKNHTCNFPENVRSVGTAMAATSAPRDTVSRYYKCGRVLVCKK